MEEIKRDTALNIYQRMAAITADLNTVGKNLHVDTGKGKGYKAVSERDIIDNVKPLEAKYGVYSYPASKAKPTTTALPAKRRRFLNALRRFTAL